MKIWQDGRAPNPRRVRIFLAEKQIDMTYCELDIMALEHKTQDRLAKNPFGRIPFLEFDDGTIIAETIAICRYFEELYPDPPLMGETPLQKAHIEMWQRRMEQNFFVPVSFTLRHSNPKMAPLEVPQVPEWAEANRDKVTEMIGFLDRHLSASRFIAGDHFSIADITALCCADFMKVSKFFIDPGHKGLKRWHDEVSQRPSARA